MLRSSTSAFVPARPRASSDVKPGAAMPSILLQWPSAPQRAQSRMGPTQGSSADREAAAAGP